MRGMCSCVLIAVLLLCLASSSAAVHLRPAAPRTRPAGLWEDLEPVLRNYSGSAPLHAAVAAGDFPTNPKNGTPWYRTKSVADIASTNHRHFGALRASGDFRSDVLAAHAAVRQRVGLPELLWSEGLAKLAADRLGELAEDGCYIRHSTTHYRWEQAGFRYVGENLYKVINYEPSGVDVVDAWYAELEDYNYGSVGASCTRRGCAGRVRPPCALGHFTQVMWEATTHLGCAVAGCPSERQPTFVAVCHYGPGGNIVGELPFASARAAALGLSAEACDGSGRSAATAAAAAG